MATQNQLGKNLLAALKRGGTEQAIPFCNNRALPLTDSMARETHSTIQRVTNKPRNPLNAASRSEIAVLEAYQQQLDNGQPLKGVIHKANGRDVYYFPIRTNAMCLQCHGQPGTEVSALTLGQLKTFYPEDEALGYAANELRGLWKVSLNKDGGISKGD